MKLGIILQSNNPEHVWNTLRLGITAATMKDLVAMIEESDKVLAFG